MFDNFLNFQWINLTSLVHLSADMSAHSLALIYLGIYHIYHRLRIRTIVWLLFHNISLYIRLV